MKSAMKQAIIVISAALASGCAHPFLKAGANLSASIQKGDAAVATLMDAEADTFRTYRFIRPATKVFKINSPDDLDGDFVAAVCRPHAKLLATERVALINMEQFRAVLETNATDPKEPTLSTLIGSLRADAASFNPKKAQDAAEEYQAKKVKDYLACTENVRKDFVAAAPAGALTAAVALAAWPKVRDFLILLLSEADKRKREARILAMLKDPEIKRALDDSLRALSTSVTSGRLGELALSRRQLALWSSYGAFTTVKGLPQPPPDIATFRELDEAVAIMLLNMKIYDGLAAVDLNAVLISMNDALEKMQKAAESGVAPDSSLMAELFATMDFLSNAAEKYGAAVGAFEEK